MAFWIINIDTHNFINGGLQVEMLAGYFFHIGTDELPWVWGLWRGFYSYIQLSTSIVIRTISQWTI